MKKCIEINLITYIYGENFIEFFRTHSLPTVTASFRNYIKNSAEKIKLKYTFITKSSELALLYFVKNSFTEIED